MKVGFTGTCVEGLSASDSAKLIAHIGKQIEWPDDYWGKAKLSAVISAGVEIDGLWLWSPELTPAEANVEVPLGWVGRTYMDENEEEQVHTFLSFVGTSYHEMSDGNFYIRFTKHGTLGTTEAPGDEVLVWYAAMGNSFSTHEEVQAAIAADEV